MNLNEPRLAGVVHIAAAILSLFVGGNWIFGAIWIGYGVACLVFPQKLFPSRAVVEARRDALRTEVIGSRSVPIPWFASPIFLVPLVGFTGFALYSYFNAVS
jgi:hypothetical protein